MSSFEDFWYKLHGSSNRIKSAYRRLFNTKDKEDGKIVLNDLMMQFRFYGAKPTNDPIELGKQAARREMLEYILAMSARVNSDTLDQIEQFINH